MLQQVRALFEGLCAIGAGVRAVVKVHHPHVAPQSIRKRESSVAMLALKWSPLLVHTPYLQGRQFNIPRLET